MREVCVASDLGEDVARLGVFIGTYILALALMLFILHPLICFFVAKRNPFKFMASLTEPMLIVFATTLT
jgi:Na+/H+-dicarboxylate symporter